MSVQTVCSACGARDENEDGFPRCRHFRRNRELGYKGPVALGLIEAFFVRRRLRPPWWIRC
jgi:hypothetical protein